MERKVFEEKYNAASVVRDPLFKEKVQESTERLGKESKMVVCMEDLAELLQALSKSFRNKGDRLNLVEELGDQLICVESMRQIYDISEDELNRVFSSAREFVSEKKTQDSGGNNVIFYMKEVIEITHILSKYFEEDFSQPQMLSLLCSILVCIDGLCKLTLRYYRRRTQ